MLPQQWCGAHLPLEWQVPASIGALTVTAQHVGALLTLPRAQDPTSPPRGHQPLPQPCCSTVDLQLLTALPCPAMGSHWAGPSHGAMSWPGLSSSPFRERSSMPLKHPWLFQSTTRLLPSWQNHATIAYKCTKSFPWAEMFAHALYWQDWVQVKFICSNHFLSKHIQRNSFCPVPHPFPRTQAIRPSNESSLQKFVCLQGKSSNYQTVLALALPSAEPQKLCQTNSNFVGPEKKHDSITQLYSLEGQTLASCSSASLECFFLCLSSALWFEILGAAPQSFRAWDGSWTFGWSLLKKLGVEGQNAERIAASYSSSCFPWERRFASLNKGPEGLS